MMFTNENLVEITAAFQKMEDFKNHILKRAETWVAVHQNNESKKLPPVSIFEHSSGFSIRISDLFDVIHGISEDVKFAYRDVQANSVDREFIVPREFIFADPNETDREYETYRQLKEKFEGK